MKRKIITIDETLCDGCGDCIPNCPEGALQIVDGKARLISEIACDGFGACVGHCPKNAITIEERDAPEYNEKVVLDNILKQSTDVLVAHLKHLSEHSPEYYQEALSILKSKGKDIPDMVFSSGLSMSRCPGVVSVELQMSNVGNKDAVNLPEERYSYSELRQWPIQLHLISPHSSYFRNADVVLSADCVAYAMGDFHSRFLKGKKLLVACPKLDNNLEVYVQKIIKLIDESMIRSLNIIIMEVPCCSGLVRIVKQALQNCRRTIPLTVVRVSISGQIIEEQKI